VRAASDRDRSETRTCYGKRRLREIDKRIDSSQHLDNAEVVDRRAGVGEQVFFGAQVLISMLR
jgi:transcription elongation GreA/GreB family factor